MATPPAGTDPAEAIAETASRPALVVLSNAEREEKLVKDRARMKAGTIKAACFAVLERAGAGGKLLKDLLADLPKELPSFELKANAAANIRNQLVTDDAFARVGEGIGTAAVWGIRALVPPCPPSQAKKPKAKVAKESAEGAAAGGEAAAGAVATGDEAKPKPAKPKLAKAPKAEGPPTTVPPLSVAQRALRLSKLVQSKWADRSKAALAANKGALPPDGEAGAGVGSPLKAAKPVRAFGEEAVGKRLWVWWEGNDEWFNGKVAAFGGAEGEHAGLHHVQYDDGDDDWADLAEEFAKKTMDFVSADDPAEEDVPDAPADRLRAEEEAEEARDPELLRFEVPEDKALYRGAPEDRKALMAHKLELEKLRKKLEIEREAYLKQRRAKKKASSAANVKGKALSEVTQIGLERAQAALKQAKSLAAAAEKAAAADAAHAADAAAAGSSGCAAAVAPVAAAAAAATEGPLSETQEALLEAEADAAVAAAAIALYEERIAKSKNPNETKLLNELLAEDRALAKLSASRIAKAQAKEAKQMEKQIKSKYPIEDLDLLAEETATAAALGTAFPKELPQALPVPGGASFADEAAVAEFLATLGKGLEMGLGKNLGRMKAVPIRDLRRAFAEAEAGGGHPALEHIYLPLLRGALAAQTQANCVRAKRWNGLLDRVKECWPEVVRQLVLKQDKDKECAPAAVAACEALRRAPLALLSRAHQAALLLQLCNDVCDLASVRELIDERLTELAELRQQRQEEEAAWRRKAKERQEVEKEKRKAAREKAAKEAEQEDPAAAAAAAGAGADADGDAGAVASRHTRRSGKEAQEFVPTFELPAELETFTGDEDDEEEREEWEQRRAKELDRLTRAREAYEKQQSKAEQAEAEKERRLREREEEQRRKQRDAFDAAAAKCGVRSKSLGLDRYFSRYWMDLGGAGKGTVTVESASGDWGCISTPDELDKLIGALNPKGIRELALRGALQKNYTAITAAMRKGMLPGGESAADLLASADTKRAGGAAGAAGSGAGASGAAEARAAAEPGCLEAAAAALEEAGAIVEAAGGQIEGGMGEWRRAVQAAGSGGDAAALRPLMVSLEEAATECAAEAGLYYDLAETDFSDEGEEEEAAEDQSPLWRTAKDRAQWHSDVHSASGLARLAFLAASLLETVEGILRLQRNRATEERAVREAAAREAAAAKEAASREAAAAAAAKSAAAKAKRKQTERSKAEGAGAAAAAAAEKAAEREARAQLRNKEEREALLAALKETGGGGKGGKAAGKAGAKAAGEAPAKGSEKPTRGAAGAQGKAKGKREAAAPAPKQPPAKKQKRAAGAISKPAAQVSGRGVGKGKGEGTGEGSAPASKRRRGGGNGNGEEEEEEEDSEDADVDSDGSSESASEEGSDGTAPSDGPRRPRKGDAGRMKSLRERKAAAAPARATRGGGARGGAAAEEDAPPVKGGGKRKR